MSITGILLTSGQLNLRSGFYAGLFLALVLALYLYRLWQPERQVALHSQHLLSAIERKDWSKVGEFIDAKYGDRWGQDRETLLLRMRAIFPYARNLRLNVVAPSVSLNPTDATWTARITVEAEPNEIADLIKARVNQLDAPFALSWHRVGQPWEWELTRTENAALELPNEMP